MNKKLNKTIAKLGKVMDELKSYTQPDSTAEEKALNESLKACSEELDHYLELRKDEHTKHVSDMTVYELRMLIREELQHLIPFQYTHTPAIPMPIPNYYRQEPTKFDVFCKEGEV